MKKSILLSLLVSSILCDGYASAQSHQTLSIVTDSIASCMTEEPQDLNKKTFDVNKLNRFQEPIKPYPYKEEEVYIKNGDITLAATLTLPDGDMKCPAVVLVSGSGAQNRDEELMGHRPFLVIADYLTRNGISVLRYDDRGFAKSTGDFASATTFDFATDVRAAVSYLKTRKEIDPKRLGIIGHSEGGIIAPLVAVDEPKLDFIVLLGGSAVRGDSVLMMQSDLIAEVSGVNTSQRAKAAEINRKLYDLIIQHKSREEIIAVMTGFMDLNTAMKDASVVTSPWFRAFINYDPSPTLSKVKCRVLEINGTKDLQVPYKENVEAMERALKKGRNKRY
ncbi:MAG: alpha/beta hydrolase family protein, partial [Bacteroidales bacterium]